jgi:RNA chaperone Hfq
MQARTSSGRNFQDDVLEHLMQRHSVTTIYLRNRLSLRGRIVRFDPYVILLEPLDGTPVQMVYKSSVVSVTGPRRVPPGPGQRGPGGPGRGPGRGPGGPPRGPRPEGRDWDRGPRPDRYGPRHEGYGPRPEGPRPEGYRPEGYGPEGPRPEDRPEGYRRDDPERRSDE